MAELRVTIPESLKSFIEGEVAAGRFRDSEDYIASLVHEAQRRKARAKVEVLLQEALDSEEVIEATPEFWERVEKTLGSFK